MMHRSSWHDSSYTESDRKALANVVDCAGVADCDLHHPDEDRANCARTLEPQVQIPKDTGEHRLLCYTESHLTWVDQYSCGLKSAPCRTLPTGHLVHARRQRSLVLCVGLTRSGLALTLFSETILPTHFSGKKAFILSLERLKIVLFASMPGLPV